MFRVVLLLGMAFSGVEFSGNVEEEEDAVSALWKDGEIGVKRQKSEQDDLIRRSSF